MSELKKFLTKKEAVEYLGANPITFSKYCDRLGIGGHREGRCIMYARADIIRYEKLMAGRAALLISQLEKITGKKVHLT